MADDLEISNATPAVASSGEAAPLEPSASVGVGAATAPTDTPSVPEAAPAPAATPTLLEGVQTEKKPDPQPAGEPVKAEGEAAKAASPEVQPAPEPEPLSPVAYEYTLPETISLPEEEKAKVHEAFDAFRTDPAKGAQALIDLHAAKMQEYADSLLAKQIEVFNETRKGWARAAKQDEQIGGSGFETSMGAIARMRDMFVPEKDMPAFNEFLRVTGAGDHPAFLKLLHNVARAYDEPPQPSPNPKPTPNQGLPPGRRAFRTIYAMKG